MERTTNSGTQRYLPKVRNDPGYLESHGYTVMRAGTAEKRLTHGRLTGLQSRLEFTVPLPAGSRPTELAGALKFNMPSSEAIYLHDTPNHNLSNVIHAH